MPASGPYDKWTKADLADELNITHGYFSQIVLDKGCPKLVPDLIAGRLHLFDDSTANAWLVAYRRWREQEPQRKAARRAEIAAREQAALNAEMKRIEIDSRLQAEAQAATDRFNSEREEWEAEVKKGWK